MYLRRCFYGSARDTTGNGGRNNRSPVLVCRSPVSRPPARTVRGVLSYNASFRGFPGGLPSGNCFFLDGLSLAAPAFAPPALGIDANPIASRGFFARHDQEYILRDGNTVQPSARFLQGCIPQLPSALLRACFPAPRHAGEDEGGGAERTGYGGWP